MNHLCRTGHDRVPIPRRKPRSLTGGRGKKNLEDGWPPPTVVEDKQRQIFSCKPTMSTFPIAIVDTVMVFDEIESKTSEKITASYTIK